MSKKLAVLILTYNEEKNIVDCINTVKFADEIIVIDSGSTDCTVELAESAGAKVVYHAMEQGFAAQRNFALTQTDLDWVMYLDADERITLDLAEEIKSIVHIDDKAGYEILRMNIVFGKMVKYGGHSPDYSLRLYPRTAIRWEGAVHEQAIVSLPIKRLKNVMHHHTYTDWDRYFFKFNQYTTLMAQQMYAKGKRAKFSDITLRPLFAFIRFYMLKSGWRDGKIGFIFAVLHAFYTMAKYVKLDYLQKARPKTR